MLKLKVRKWFSELCNTLTHHAVTTSRVNLQASHFGSSENAEIEYVTVKNAYSEKQMK